MPKSLREILSAGETVLCPGAYDAWTAKLVEEAGFNSCSLTGFGVAGSMGYPDVGLVTQTEVAQRIEQMRRVLTVPLIVDGDTGYGSPNNVARTVRDFANAGASAIHLEDQPNPKRCGAMEGKQLVPIAEMQERLAAAVAARPDKDFLIIARTDAPTVTNLADAIERGRRYIEAGADVTFVLGPKNDADMQAYAEQVPATKQICITSSEISPRWTVTQLTQAGYHIIVFPLNTLMAAVPAIRWFLSTLRQTGDVKPMLSKLAPFEELNKLLNLEHYLGFEMQTKRQVSVLGGGKNA